MRSLIRSKMFIAGALALTVLLRADGSARADNFHLQGAVAIFKLPEGIAKDGVMPYVGVGLSGLIGPNIQTGTIKNLTGLMPVDATTLTFDGEVGPHPSLPGHPKVHVITTLEGDIFCTWTAVFTLKIVSLQGDAVLSGDGDFKVIGGTGHYKNATGRFRTVFTSDTVAAGADHAIASVVQTGDIRRR